VPFIFKLERTFIHGPRPQRTYRFVVAVQIGLSSALMDLLSSGPLLCKLVPGLLYDRDIVSDDVLGSHLLVEWAVIHDRPRQHAHRFSIAARIGPSSALIGCHSYGLILDKLVELAKVFGDSQ